jgi:hypothetical protein
MRQRHGISALQLVLVLGILLMGMAFMVPAIQRVREAASRTQAMNNLRQMALAMHNYHDVYKGLPPAVGEAQNQNGPTHFHILPFLEQDAIFRNAEGASWKNQTYGTVIPVYLDPRDASSSDPIYKNWLATTSYPVNWLVTKEGKMSLVRIVDGTSNTLMFAQRYQMCNGEPTAWGYPSIHTWAPIFAYYSESKFQTAPSPSDCDPRRAQSIGREMLVAMCDGSAMTLSRDLRPSTWYYLCSPDDGNPLPQDDLDR